MQVKYLMPRIYTYPNGRPMLYLTEEVAFQTRMRYHCHKGFPLLGRLDELLGLLASAGLVAKWDLDAVFKVLRIDSEPDHEPLSLEHLQAAFYVWTFGQVASLVALIAENFTRWITTCRGRHRTDKHHQGYFT